MTTKNAFSAFGFDPDIATVQTLRTDLAFALRLFIENSQNSGTGQAKIGEILGFKQSVVSQIKRGNIEHLSVERLIRAMVKAKIPGFAEWGATAEAARAGVGLHAPLLTGTSISVAPTVGNVYSRDWLGDKSVTELPWLQVKALR